MTTWIIDSGATDHICCDLNLFADVVNITSQHSTITIRDGNGLQVQHKGTVHFGSHIKLNNVLHVAHFKFNLISVRMLCKDKNCSISFTNYACHLSGPFTEPLLLGNFKNGLYCLDGSHLLTSVSNVFIYHSNLSVSPSSSIFTCFSAIEQAKLWHLRLGLLPFVHINKVFPSVTLHDYLNECTCPVYHYARQTRLPFPHSFMKTSKDF